MAGRNDLRSGTSGSPRIDPEIFGSYLSRISQGGVCLARELDEYSLTQYERKKLTEAIRKGQAILDRDKSVPDHYRTWALAGPTS
jgi:hypothetical protein